MRDGTEKDHYSERLNHQFRERESGADLEPEFCGKKECSVQQKADVCRFGGTEKVQSEGSVPDW